MKPEKFATARHRRQHARRVCSPEKTKLDDFAYKAPPTPRVGLVWPRPHRPALILLFAKKFFRRSRDRLIPTAVIDRGYNSRMRWTGQIFWLLAYDACAARTFFPPSPTKLSGIGPMGSRIQLQQRNCSRFARDFLRRPTFPSSQRTGTRSSASRSGTQDLFSAQPQTADPVGQWNRRPRAFPPARQGREQPRRVCRSK